MKKLLHVKLAIVIVSKVHVGYNIFDVIFVVTGQIKLTTIMFCCSLFSEFVDLEDIQKKRRKQIPNFTDNDSFMNSISMMLTYVVLTFIIWSLVN